MLCCETSRAGKPVPPLYHGGFNCELPTNQQRSSKRIKRSKASKKEIIFLFTVCRVSISQSTVKSLNFIYQFSMAEVTNQVSTTTTNADSSDWKSSCVQPAKDTRVQTEVINVLNLKIQCISIKFILGCYCH